MNDVWELVLRIEECDLNRRIKNNLDENGGILWNKVRILAQGHFQLRVLILMRHLHML